ncbi:GNAT family N-acetyltransferase [Chitinimonas naiadis]
MSHASYLIRPATAADISVIIRLAHEIWHAHYPGIVSIEQIDYMLGQRYNEATLLEQLSGAEQWLDLALLDDRPVGFTQYLRIAPGTIKLDKLYLLPELHGQGFGSRMLDHVEHRARELAGKQLTLAVNKQNEKAIAAYLRNGFSIADSTQVDIGQGFIMDDYVMVKPLPL